MSIKYFIHIVMKVENGTTLHLNLCIIEELERAWLRVNKHKQATTPNFCPSLTQIQVGNLSVIKLYWCFSRKFFTKHSFS